jgi:hypothetical protein
MMRSYSEDILERALAPAVGEDRGTNHHGQNGGIWHTQLLVFQQLLPLPLSFKFSLFASSKKRAPPGARAS